MERKKRILKAVFVAADSSGPAYHDIVVPTYFFRKHKLLDCKIVRSISSILDDPETDIIGFQRQYLPTVLMYIRAAKAKNKVITTICDDNIWELLPNNPARDVYTGMVLERYEAILREVHAVFVPTKYLYDKCLQFNKNTYINRCLVEMSIHNLVFPDKDDDQKDKIRILWHGTLHHHDDVEMVVPALKEITNKYPQVTWVFMGYMPPSFEKWCPPQRYEYYSFVPTSAFYPAIASLDADIGFAPLVDHPFNWGKTSKKAQEYAILGVPMILAPVRTYEDWEHGVTCLKPKSNYKNAWVQVFSKMIEMPLEERFKLAEAAFYYVKENHDADKFIFERAATLYKIWNDIQGDNLALPTDPDWNEL